MEVNDFKQPLYDLDGALRKALRAAPEVVPLKDALEIVEFLTDKLDSPKRETRSYSEFRGTVPPKL